MGRIKINEKTVNFILILILGFLVGVAVKTEAKKRVTIGYGDYIAAQMKQDFDLMKKEAPRAPAGGGQPEQPAPVQGEESPQGASEQQ
jgi:hypothetical protein